MSTPRQRWVAALAAIAVAGVAVWYALRDEGTEPLVLAGTIETRSVQAGALVGGRIETVSADEGDRVAAGQVLLRLEGSLLAPQVDEQRARVAEAEAVVARARRGPRAEDLERARISWEAAKTERARFEKLWQDGVVGRREYDQTLVAEATTRETYLERQRGSRPEDLAAAVAALDREGQRLLYLERQVAELEVRAPVAGVIQAFDLRPGDLVTAGQPLVTLLETDQLWVRVFVPETRLGEVQVGQHATLTVDSFPDRGFPGLVVEIRDRGEYTPRNLQTLEQRIDLVFGVKVRVDPTPELKAGMSALVRLVRLDASGTGAPPP